MIARVATFHQFDPHVLDPRAVERLRTIIKDTPGYVAGFHLWNPETGKAISFTVYESAESLRAAGKALGERADDEQDGIDPDPDEVDYYTDVYEF